MRDWKPNEMSLFMYEQHASPHLQLVGNTSPHFYLWGMPLCGGPAGAELVVTRLLEVVVDRGT